MAERAGSQSRPEREPQRQQGSAVSRTLAELSRILRVREHTQDVLRDIVEAAVLDLPGADHAAISMRSPQGAATPVASSPVAEKLDLIQHTAGAGPWLAFSPTRRSVRIDDLARDHRWPEFTTLAMELGVQSMLSIQLFIEGDQHAALTTYGSRPHAFDDEAESVAVVLASHAAVAMVGARTEAELRAALTTRDVIGQAKGVLMERHKISGDEAFALLVRGSQATQRKLRDVAEMVASTGQDPAGRR